MDMLPLSGLDQCLYRAGRDRGVIGIDQGPPDHDAELVYFVSPSASLPPTVKMALDRPALAQRGKPMENTHAQRRWQLYFKLSSAIAQIDNAHVRSLLEAQETQNGWGKSQTIEIERSKVFVKRVPLTDIEYEHMFSTRNVYDLPTYYNYGIGSAGLGIFRELVTHIKTTNWVLEGAIASFPLLYHYRIIPFFGERAAVDMERHERYVSYWGGNANIDRYILILDH